MVIFISWSGEKSRAVAKVLKDWLPKVLPLTGDDLWMSDQNITKGTRWYPKLVSKLEETDLGLICLTSENLREPWILYEAGALSKSIDQSYLWTILLDIKHTDIKGGPLYHFEHTIMEKDDIRNLIIAINNSLGNKAVDNKYLSAAFNYHWPELEEGIKKIKEINVMKIEGWKETKKAIDDIFTSAKDYIYGIVEDFSSIGSFDDSLANLNENVTFLLICSPHGLDIANLTQKIDPLKCNGDKILYVHPSRIGKTRILFNEKFGIFVLHAGDEYFGIRIEPSDNLYNYFNILKEESHHEKEPAKFDSKYTRIKRGDLAELIIWAIEENTNLDKNSRYLYIYCNKFTMFSEFEPLRESIKNLANDGIEISIILGIDANDSGGYTKSLKDLLRDELGEYHNVEINTVKHPIGLRRTIITNTVAIDLLDFDEENYYNYSIIYGEKLLNAMRHEFGNYLR